MRGLGFHHDLELPKSLVQSVYGVLRSKFYNSILLMDFPFTGLKVSVRPCLALSPVSQLVQLFVLR